MAGVVDRLGGSGNATVSIANDVVDGENGVDRERQNFVDSTVVRSTHVYIVASSGKPKNNTLSIDSLVINVKKLSNVLRIEKILLQLLFFLVNKNYIEKEYE